MSPIGHVSASYLAGRVMKKVSMPALLIGGILPDIDFIFFKFSFFNDIHRLMTHNLLFVFSAVLFIGLFTRKPYRLSIMSGLLIGGCLHLIADSIMDTNAANGIGIPLFWPFDSTFYSPFNLMQPENVSDGWNDPAAMFRLALQGLIYELPLCALAVIALLTKRKSLLPIKNKT
jgi:membrane-bound metal-dependent hydrolase YbcI (DUF457 family)